MALLLLVRGFTRTVDAPSPGLEGFAVTGDANSTATPHAKARVLVDGLARCRRRLARATTTRTTCSSPGVGAARLAPRGRHGPRASARACSRRDGLATASRRPSRRACSAATECCDRGGRRDARNALGRRGGDGYFSRATHVGRANARSSSSSNGTAVAALAARPWLCSRPTPRRRRPRGHGSRARVRRRDLHASSTRWQRRRAGLAVDGAGRVYSTSENCVAVLAPDGALLGTLKLDDTPTGLALATDAHMYITTAGGRLLRVPVRRGVRPADVAASYGVFYVIITSLTRASRPAAPPRAVGWYTCGRGPRGPSASSRGQLELAT